MAYARISSLSFARRHGNAKMQNSIATYTSISGPVCARRPLPIKSWPATTSKTFLPTVVMRDSSTLTILDTGNTGTVSTGVQMEETSLSPERKSQILLTSATAGMMSAIAICNIPGSEEVALNSETLSMMFRNAPLAISCSALGDLVAQKLSGVAKIDWKRTISAGAIGTVLAGFGTTVWLSNLNMLIPREMVGFDSLGKFNALFFKVVFDSATWGTFMNSANIVLRRLAGGDSLSEAYNSWKNTIMPVTKSEFKFWPAWGAMVYTAIPLEEQVNAFAVGGLIWNVYLSWMSNSKAAQATSLKKAKYGKPVGLNFPRKCVMDLKSLTGSRSTLQHFMACDSVLRNQSGGKEVSKHIAVWPKHSHNVRILHNVRATTTRSQKFSWRKLHFGEVF
eukprot:763466-Hanusia_phi.AAC.8